MKNIKNKKTIFRACLAIILLLGIVGVLAILKNNSWEENYSVKNSQPFGLEIFDRELNNILKDKKITRLNNYNYFENSYHDSIPSKTIIYLDTKFYNDEFDEILEILQKNEVFIIKNIPFDFYDKDLFSYKTITLKPKLSKPLEIEFTNPNLQEFNTPFIYHTKYEDVELKKYKPEILSTIRDKAVFKRYKIKNNYLYFCYTPQVFSNHYLKNNSLAYPSAVLSYIKNKEVVVFNEGYPYQNDPNNFNEQENRSILYFILGNKYLKIALYLFLFGAIAFTLFKIKRVQRTIPILPENKNRSLEFIQTISNLYFNNGNNLGILKKMNQQFLSRVEKKYHLKTTVLDDNFSLLLAKYSNQDVEFVKQVISKIKYYDATHFNPKKEEVNNHYINLKKIS